MFFFKSTKEVFSVQGAWNSPNTLHTYGPRSDFPYYNPTTPHPELPLCTTWRILRPSPVGAAMPWSYSYGSWVYNYLCNWCLSPMRCTTLCDKVYQLLATGRLFSPVSSTNKTDHHDLTELLLKVMLNNTKPNLHQYQVNRRMRQRKK